VVIQTLQVLVQATPMCRNKLVEWGNRKTKK